MATRWRQARVFHGFAMLRRNKETNRVSPSFHRQLFQWGNNNSTGPIFTKQSQRTKCIVREGVICEGSFTHSSSLCCCCDPPCSRLCYLFRNSADYGRFFHASLYFPCYLHREAARQRPVALIAFRTGHGGGWDTFVRAARLVWSKRTRELAQLK